MANKADTKFEVSCNGSLAAGVTAHVKADLNGAWSGASYWVTLWAYDASGVVLGKSYDQRPWPQTMHGQAEADVSLAIQQGDVSGAVSATVYVWKWYEPTVPVSTVANVPVA